MVFSNRNLLSGRVCHNRFLKNDYNCFQNVALAFFSVGGIDILFLFEGVLRWMMYGKFSLGWVIFHLWMTSHYHGSWRLFDVLMHRVPSPEWIHPIKGCVTNIAFQLYRYNMYCLKLFNPLIYLHSNYLVLSLSIIWNIRQQSLLFRWTKWRSGWPCEAIYGGCTPPMNIADLAAWKPVSFQYEMHLNTEKLWMFHRGCNNDMLQNVAKFWLKIVERTWSWTWNNIPTNS